MGCRLWDHTESDMTERLSSSSSHVIPLQDGRLERCALIFSSENSKIATAAEQPSTAECWIPPKKDTPHQRAKVKPQQDGRRGKIAYRIKPQIPERLRRFKKKPCVPQETPQRWSTGRAFDCLSVSCKGTGQQWPATGSGALGAIDLGVA